MQGYLESGGGWIDSVPFQGSINQQSINSIYTVDDGLAWQRQSHNNQCTGLGWVGLECSVDLIFTTWAVERPVALSVRALSVAVLLLQNARRLETHLSETHLDMLAKTNFLGLPNQSLCHELDLWTSKTLPELPNERAQDRFSTVMHHC